MNEVNFGAGIDAIAEAACLRTPILTAQSVTRAP